MPDPEPDGMVTEGRLRDIDRTLLDMLQDGRVTPLYCYLELVARKRATLPEDERDAYDPDEDDDIVSRQYIQQRLAWLMDTGHVENLHGSGMYELRDDPRETDD